MYFVIFFTQVQIKKTQIIYKALANKFSKIKNVYASKIKISDKMVYNNTIRWYYDGIFM